jgi:hypothetical protein
MKKTMLIILLSLGLKGMAQTNNLIVFDQQGEPFWAILNGVRQNVNPQTNVKITGLNSNTYKLKLIFKDSTKAALDKTVFYNTMGTEETYNVVVKNNGERVIRAMSMVPLAQAAPADPSQTVIVYGAPPVTGGTTTTVTQQTTTVGDPNVNAVNVNMGGMSVGMNVTGMAANTQQTTVTTTTTSTTSDGGYQQTNAAPQGGYVEGYSGPVGCPMPMSHDDYESAKSSISGKDFENTKLDMAKQITTSNCLTAEEVRGIMKLFTFENTKLDYAKFAYSHTYDKANYFKVNDAFQFDSSSTELTNYISGH